MRRRVDTTLIPQAHLKLKSFSIRLPADVMERMQRVKDDAQALGYVFDVNMVLTDALIYALDRAEKELETMLEKGDQ